MADLLVRAIEAAAPRSAAVPVARVEARPVPAVHAVRPACLAAAVEVVVAAGGGGGKEKP